MAKAHDRILEIVFTADESDDTVVVTAVNWYRDRAHLTDADPLALAHTAGSAAGTHEVTLGEVIPTPTHLRLKSTFQA